MALFYCSDSPGGAWSNLGGSVANTNLVKIIPTNCCCVCCYATQKTQPKSSHCFSEFSCSLMQGFCVSEPVPPAPGASCVFECKYSFLVCHVSRWAGSLWCLGAQEAWGMLTRTVAAAWFFCPTQSSALSQRSCLPAHGGLLCLGRLSLCCYCGIFKTHPVAYHFLGVHRQGGPVMTAVHLHCVSYPFKIG